jgi:hypothetical protein
VQLVLDHWPELAFLAMIATCMLLTLIHKRHRFDHYKEVREYYYEQIRSVFHPVSIGETLTRNNTSFQSPPLDHRVAFCGYRRIH